jgi:DMSO/TMAO reductase YedYZ molybdopterin-dependent catalytic subunit
MKPNDLPFPTSSVARRDFLRAAALGTFPLLAGAGAGLAQSPRPPAHPGLIIRESEPENLEFPFATLDSFITRNEFFYIRNHFPVPKLDVRTWSLKVEGAVERPLELRYEELLQMPSRTVTALLECAGNSRVFLTPRVRGVAWQSGAVGNAEWTGVPLGAVLERAGLRPSAVEVVLDGADRGEVRDEPRSPGVISFSRSLPLAKAQQADVLLAYRMNGVELSPAHGYPLRAIVPGWYGMASIKWLTRLVVVEQPFQGFFQSLDYTYWKRDHGLPTLVPITELHVKAAIARPTFQEVVAAGSACKVHGAAWSGETEVQSVQVSTDGKQWHEARLLGKAVPYAWRLWEYEWRTPSTPGRYTLRARAKDRKGRTQPEQHDPDRRTYQISHVLPVEVEVRS